MNGRTLLRILIFYIALPVCILLLLRAPIGSAVLADRLSSVWILAAALCAVGMNWLLYARLYKKRPPLPVFAYGVLCLLAVILLMQHALPVDDPLVSSLAFVGGFLALLFLYLFGVWCASRSTRTARVFTIIIQVILGMVLCLMALQILRDLESRRVTADTWITLVIFLLTLNAAGILFYIRRTIRRRRTKAVAPGRIVQIIGVTGLDRDDDPFTRHRARIQYTVNGETYETHAKIAGITVRRIGRDKLVGWVVPVCYNPANPAEAWVERISRHVFEG